MRRFIFKSLFFVLPFTILLGEGFLPIGTFTHRPWEALLFRSSSAMPFYPNQTFDFISVGGLCHHTPYAIRKKENWVTDELGYRNNTFVEDPDVILIGDSFITGSSISQESTITNLLKGELNNNKVYNISPAAFTDFVDLYERGIIKKPKTIVFSFVERFVPTPIKSAEERAVSRKETAFAVFKDKMNRFYSKKYLKARIKGEVGSGIQGTPDSRMFFLNGKNQEYHYDKLREVANNILSYKEYCDSIGVDFIFLPLPNKETVYYDKVPFDTQPDYLVKLDSLLGKKVNSINALELFNDYRESSSDIIYHLDDSHWNPRGIRLVVAELAQKLSASAP